MAPGSRRRSSRLIALGLHVASICDDDRLHNQLLGLDGPGNSRNQVKKLIFAADGPKPQIVLRDAINNDPEIGENAEHCLVYDRGLGLTGLPEKQNKSPSSWQIRKIRHSARTGL
jgi:hypothetical protein